MAPRTPKNQPQPVDPDEIFEHGGDQPGDSARLDAIHAAMSDDAPAAESAASRPDIDQTPAERRIDASDPAAVAAGPIDFEKLRADLEAKAAAAMPGGALADLGDDDDPTAGDAPIAFGDNSGATSGEFFLDLAAAAAGPKPIAAGTRALVAVTAAEVKIGQSSGNPYIALRVKTERILQTPASADDAAYYRNRTIRDNVTFAPPNPVTGSRGSVWRAKLTFEAFGVPWADLRFTSKAAFREWLEKSAEEFIGAVAEAEIGIETSTGTDDSGQPYPDKNTIARFFPYVAPAAASAPADTGDDIPF